MTYMIKDNFHFLFFLTFLSTFLSLSHFYPSSFFELKNKGNLQCSHLESLLLFKCFLFPFELICYEDNRFTKHKQTAKHYYSLAGMSLCCRYVLHWRVKLSLYKS